MTSQSQIRSAHAISNPTLAGIEKRWEAMPPQEQAELWMLLRDRMKVDWHEMTLQEKKAGMETTLNPFPGKSGIIDQARKAMFMSRSVETASILV
jgi:cytochrome c oxidase subunit 4